MAIKNVGREALSISGIQCETFIKLEEMYYQDMQTLYIPIVDYYTTHGDHPKLIGDVMTDISIGNNWNYLRFYKECVDNSLSRNKYFCELVNFVIIPYVDIYEEEHTVYFENDQRCSKEYFDDIVKKSRNDFKERYFRLSELKLDDLKKYSKIDKTRKMAR